MTVKELRKLLKRFPQHLQVITPLWSEHRILEPHEIGLIALCEPREDGWVHDNRDDKPTQDYVVIT